MLMSRRIVLAGLAGLTALSLGVSVPLRAQQEGTEFRRVIPRQPTESPGKIEVTEFFSYACPHCHEFYPLLTAWIAQQPKDVVLKRVPVGFGRPPWENLQRAFYALKVTGDYQRLDGLLFSAIHDKHEMLDEEPALAEWVAHNGGSADKFAEDYAVDAVPTMAVNGEYVALGDSYAEILTNTTKLVARVRAERAAAKPAR